MWRSHLQRFFHLRSASFSGRNELCSTKKSMKSSYHKMLAGLVVAFTLLSAPTSVLAQAQNAAIVTPDGGATFSLLVLGLSGLAIAARTLFKR